MSLPTVGARRRVAYALPRSAMTAPWNSSTTPCVVPTPDGSGATIHPSVYDFGTRWNGFRWWMANTPYPSANGSLENPCIYGSDDRRTWTVPAGLTNPLALPPNTWFHSDTELAFDPDAGRLYVFYRVATQTTSPPTIQLLCRSSTDGTVWADHGLVADLPGTGARVSPAIWRVSGGDWRMWLFGGTPADLWTAPAPTGPWTKLMGCPGLYGWHGDVIHHAGLWRAASSSLGNGGVYLYTSTDGITWSTGSLVMTGGMGGGWDETLYRPTLLPSTLAGHMDVWCSAYGAVPGGCATDYVRLPLSLWPAPPA